MTALSPGTLLTGMVAVTVRVTVSRTEMFEDFALETKALSLFGVIATRIGKLPTRISVRTWLVELSITATLLEYLLVTKRDWAKAEDAKAKAKVINSKGRRYVFIVGEIRLNPPLSNPPRILELNLTKPPNFA